MNISELRFHQNFTSALPGDFTNSLQSRMTPQVIYSAIHPTPVKKPECIAWSDDAAEILNLSQPKSTDGEEAHFFAGNKIFENMQPFTTRYGGHQFGNWAGQLGDGRAITLSEVFNNKNESWEIQLKGAGRTPYSRRGDGRAVLRSSLREFICSEAMFHLNVPTTRALCCVTTGEEVLRDMFYDGNPEHEPGAITTRLAPTFLRFGHFEILAASDEKNLLKDLITFTIKNYFPGFSYSTNEDIGTWFTEICKRTAVLMAQWMRVGFIHAVMNTDNMSIVGLTIDYGPFSFLDNYDPDWTPNTTDAENRRYRFAAQPEIAFWNLIKLAEALLVLVEEAPLLEKGLQVYQETYNEEYFKMVANKLGLKKINPQDDFPLLKELDQVLRCEDIDMTIFYHKLCLVKKRDDYKILEEAFYSSSPAVESLQSLKLWVEKYLQRRSLDGNSDEDIQAIMTKANPVFIPRNYLIQMALDAFENGDRSVLDDLMMALKTPYQENEYTLKFYGKRPEWAKQRPGCSALSCSS